MRIDAHQHFWNYSAEQYPWMTDALAVLRQDKGPADLEPLLAAQRLEGSIAVQARQSLEESRWLLGLADRHPSIKGVVGWVDLRHPEVERDLAELARHPRFVGVRHVAQDEPDDDFLIRPEFVRGVARLKDFDLAYDILIYPKQLPAAIRLAERLPEQRFVLDHIAKPLVREGRLEPWASQLRTLAGFPNVWCKVSGLVTEAHWDRWQPADFRPYLEVAGEAFGPRRLMYGSDWPVCLLAGSYERVYQLADDAFGKAKPDDRDAFFGETAGSFYRLDRAADSSAALKAQQS